MSFTQVLKENGCIVSLPPCSYTLSATDVDAVDSIDIMPAVSIKDIIVQGHVSTCMLFKSEESTVLSTTYTIGVPRVMHNV